MTMKKTLSILIALVTVLSLTVFGMSAATAAATPAADSVAITSLSEITDPAGAYHLAGNITVSETYTEVFTGVLDGCGYTVTVSAPMFEKFNGTIKNMTLEGSIESATNTAAVAVYSTDGMTAMNITSNVNITVSGKGDNLWAAAIVCEASSIEATSTFMNIVNNGDISAVSDDGEKPRAGGIAGIVETGIFIDCVNNGTIYSKGTVSALSAGICARPGLTNAVSKPMEFYHCVNNGNITAEGRSADLGGIAGYVGSTARKEAEYIFSNCVNTGNITGVYRAGGIAGFVYGSASQWAVVSNCINTGTITFGGNTNTKGAPAATYASPIIGYTNSVNTIFSGCIDAGSLVCIDEGYASYAFVTSGSAKLGDGNFSDIYVVDASAKFNYAVFSTKAANYIQLADAAGIINATIDDVKSIPETTGFIKTEGMPIVAAGDSWNGNSYVIYVAEHVCGNLTFVEAQEMTCGQVGIVAHYVCDCGRCYEDAEAKTEIVNKGSLVIPITKEHIWGDTTYTWTYNERTGYPNKCVAQHVCSTCGKTESATGSLSGTKTAVTATCISTGKQYRTATFSVEWAKSVNSDPDKYITKINPNNHVFRYVSYLINETTCSSYYYCCGAVSVEKAEHTYDSTTGKCTKCKYTSGANIRTVTLMLDGSIYWTTQVPNRESTGASITPPAKEGYSFIGWYLNGDESKSRYTGSMRITADRTYEAVYRNEFKVTFRGVKADGTFDDILIIKNVPYGTKIEAPTSIPGCYTVEGKWYTNSSLTNEADIANINVTYDRYFYISLTEENHSFGNTVYTWTYKSGVPTGCSATRECTACGRIEKATAKLSTYNVEYANCQEEGIAYKTAKFDATAYPWAEEQTSENYVVAKNPNSHPASKVAYSIKDATHHTATYLCCDAAAKESTHYISEGMCTTCGYIEGAAQYTITYIVDGKIYYTQKVCYKGWVDSLSAPEKSDSAFFTWYTGENGTGDRFSSTYNYESDITYYAYYKTELDVYFRYVDEKGKNHNIKILTKVPYGSALAPLTFDQYTINIPAGYYISGWYTNNKFDTEFDFDNKVTGNVYVYGKLAELKGWCVIDGEAYYYNEDGSVATGIVRLPYPETAINGVTYAPNPEDLEYVKKDPSIVYTDAETALFMFDENGKLMAETGFVTYKGETRYAVKGMIGWHVGLVEVDGEYYYFLGDKNGCGNVMVTGDVYVTRNTTDLDVYFGGIYTFAEDGKLCKYEGLTEIGNKLYYYDGYCRSKSLGAVEVAEGKYIYVRTTNCEVVVGRQYWITETASSDLVKGMYTFDKNGYILDPVVKNSTATTGIFDGYYYENGEIAYGKGAVEIDGDIYFVRANGQVAVGETWVTQSNELLPAGKYTFDESGKLVK